MNLFRKAIPTYQQPIGAFWRNKTSVLKSNATLWRRFSTSNQGSIIERYPIRAIALTSLVALFGYYQYSIWKFKQITEEDEKQLIPKLSSFFQHHGSEYKQAALETFIECVQQEEHWNTLRTVMAPSDDAPTPNHWKWILLEQLQKQQPSDLVTKRADEPFKMVVTYFWNAKLKQYEEEQVKNSFTEPYLRKLCFEFFIPVIAVSQQESQLVVMKVEMVHQSPMKFWKQPMTSSVFYVSKIAICNPKEFWKLNDLQTMEWNLKKAKPWKGNKKEVMLEEALAPGNLKIESSWKQKQMEVYKTAQLL